MNVLKWVIVVNVQEYNLVLLFEMDLWSKCAVKVCHLTSDLVSRTYSPIIAEQSLMINGSAGVKGLDLLLCGDGRVVDNWLMISSIPG